MIVGMWCVCISISAVLCTLYIGDERVVLLYNGSTDLIHDTSAKIVVFMPYEAYHHGKFYMQILQGSECHEHLQMPF